MGSTFSCHRYHVVFGTKYREPSIEKRWRDNLYSYLGGILRRYDCVPEAIGGIEDHVHLLVGMPVTRHLPEVVRQVKYGSSRWVHKWIDRSFGWQEGYGSITVSPSLVDRVTAYIARQEEHHRFKSFEEEYAEMMRVCGLVVNEWDLRFD